MDSWLHTASRGSAISATCCPADANKYLVSSATKDKGGLGIYMARLPRSFSIELKYYGITTLITYIVRSKNRNNFIFICIICSYVSARARVSLYVRQGNMKL